MKYEVPFKKFGLLFRFVEPEDVPFIFNLRTHYQNSAVLSPISNDINDQYEWIRGYKEREKKGAEFYFITTSDDGQRYGLNRICNITTDSFEIGSWVFSPGLPMNLPILSDLAIRDWAFENFNSKFCKFEVRQINKTVINYHLKFNPELTGQDKLNCYYKLSRKNYFEYRDKLIKILKP